MKKLSLYFVVLCLCGFVFAEDLSKTSQAETFLTTQEQTALKDYLIDIADWIITADVGSGILKNTNDTDQSFFINGNLARVLVCAYRITGRQKYLNEALRWADDFCNQQDLAITSKIHQGGFWPDFPRRDIVLYANIYFGDMGTAATSLSLIYEHCDNNRKEIYLNALERMALFVTEGCVIDPQRMGREAVDSFVIKEGEHKGALGCGYYRGHLSMEPYTIATATTGGAFMSRMYKLTGDDEYREIAAQACGWLIRIAKPDGEIPYMLDGKLFDQWPLDTLTYCTEAFVGSYRYFSDEQKEKLGRDIEPTIQWLLNKQNADGTWGQLRSPDQQRSPGAVTLLNWYYYNVKNSAEVEAAVRKYAAYLLNKENSTAYGVKELVRTTGFVGLAVSDMLVPGVTF